jgi:4-alpha-glucanotransferase
VRLCVDAFQRRRAGVLLHPTSLPGGDGYGDLGPDAYAFVDFLVSTHHSVWQTLPLGPPHDGGSPYQCLSAHAGNTRLISAARLAERGWLSADAGSRSAGASPAKRHRALLKNAFDTFRSSASVADREAFARFTNEHSHWLEDYVLYLVLRETHAPKAWTAWPAPLRDRDAAALERARKDFGESLARARFAQFVFFCQWGELKRYANERGVLIFGDMPIFASHDSADVWAHREYFFLNEDGSPRAVAGVPPDYFSATGQRWGNPLYRWDRIQAEGFRWWIERLRSQLELFDLLRIDHFRGFESYWEIPAEEPTALRGRWVKAPGTALFEALRAHFGSPPLVAEDLGVITPEVEALRDRYGFPGMKILQFAFDGTPGNPYLPHAHSVHCVVYTGTHDNDTTLGWFDSLSEEQQRYVLEYLGLPQDPMPWPLIRCALASVAKLVIIPMQDLLALGSEGRMNKPSTLEGNWKWRFRWEQLSPEKSSRLTRLVQLYGRG